MKMMKLWLCFFALMFFSVVPLSADQFNPEILKQIVVQLEKNDELIDNYDFFQEQEVKELDNDGKIEKVKKHTYRTIQVQERRYFELIKIDGRDLNDKEKKDEAKRRSKFIKEIQKKDEEEDFTWADLMEKYDFTQLAAEGDAVYVISFKPRSGKLKERNRTDKILNHLEGKIWVSPDYNLIRADARLLEPVKFGLGILANVQNLELKYLQNQFDGIWVPESFSLHYKARVLVKDQIRQVQSRYFNLTKRPTASQSAATK